MLHESARLRLEAEPRFATLWLNAPTLEELHAVTSILEHTPWIERLVVRSTNSLRFQAEIDGAFAARFARLPLITLALLDGLVNEGGLELALACQYRLAVAAPDTWLGLAPGPLTHTISIPRRAARRLLAGEYVNAREAARLGLIDDAFTRRRAKIDLQSWLDRMRSRWHRPRLRRNTPSIIPMRPQPVVMASDDLPETLGLVRCPHAVPIAVEMLLRGRHVVTDDPTALRRQLDAEANRGRATPLELEHARRHILARTFDEVDVLLVGDPQTLPPSIRKHAVILQSGSSTSECEFPWLRWSRGPIGWSRIRKNFTTPHPSAVRVAA
jgi:enoyl-CoA hydratase/carnithine racemase